jgi:hypothetical protein
MSVVKSLDVSYFRGDRGYGTQWVIVSTSAVKPLDVKTIMYHNETQRRLP